MINTGVLVVPDVIILTYNRPDFFEKCLRSVCEQTYKDFTIKVFNNGSTDNTEEVYYKVKSEYPDRKFEYFRQDINDVDKYFLTNLYNFITEEFVIIIHDDDIIHPRYLETIINTLEKEPEVVLIGGKSKMSTNPESQIFDDITGKYVIGDAKELVKWYLRGDTMPFASICCNTSVYKCTNWEGAKYGNRGDLPFIVAIAEHGKVCELQDRFIHYRVHKSNDFRRLPMLQQ